MKKFLKNKKGFTLMEMLIVIAIIVILVAIAVPTFTSQLSKANEAADAANERAAKAQAAIEYLANNKTGEYLFDAASGELVSTTTTVAPYGKNGEGDVIKVTISATGDISWEWE